MPEACVRQQGFVLPAALFLVVILSALAVYLTGVTESNLATSALELQGERAYWSAQAGVEAGIHEAVVNNTCTATQNIALPQGFTVTARCVASTTKEGGKNVTMYSLTGIACNEPTAGGACPNPTPTRPDYVERQVRAIVE